MAVELARAPISRVLPQVTRTYNISNRPRLKLVSNSQAQANASKAAFAASMERAQLSQNYWEELLEKMRRAGGGGGGGNDKRFDRIAVSMMLSNFLSNKTIQAMLRNFGAELFDTNLASNQIVIPNQIQTSNIIQFINIVSNTVINSVSLIQQSISSSMKPITSTLSSILGALSFQMNKLKEILEEDLKEFINKLDVKEKMKKIKIALNDFFVELKESVFSIIDLAEKYINYFINIKWQIKQ